MTRHERHNLRVGLLFVAPWIIGFILFSLYPVLCSIWLSFCDYSVLAEPVFIGTQNYSDLFTDEIFYKAIANTVIFAAISIPSGLIASVFIAVLLNFNVRFLGIFRTIYFLPSLVPMVCLAVLWQWMLNGEIGLINNLLNPVYNLCNSLFGTHLAPPNWLQDPFWAKPGLVLAGLWGVGQAVVINLAALQEVPTHLYEAAMIDGASPRQRFIHVTLPSISPVLYFNGIMALIGSLQVFAVPYVMTNGSDGPDRSLLFLATYIYKNAFDYWNMGYACVIGLFLFLLVLLLTLIAHRVSRKHVHYEGA